MSRWDFRLATDVLTKGPTVTLARIAAKFGVQLATVARARIDTNNRRAAPVDWERVVSELALTHAGELELQARKLRRLAHDLAKSARK